MKLKWIEEIKLKYQSKRNTSDQDKPWYKGLQRKDEPDWGYIYNCYIIWAENTSVRQYDKNLYSVQGKQMNQLNNTPLTVFKWLQRQWEKNRTFPFISPWISANKTKIRVMLGKIKMETKQNLPLPQVNYYWSDYLFSGLTCTW